MPKPKIWLTSAGRVYDIAHAARLIGTTAAKLRAMIHAGEIADTGDEREAVAEADVLRLRAERGRMRVEVARRAGAGSGGRKLIDAARRETRLHERPGDQAVLNWSRFEDPAGNIERDPGSILS